MTRPRQSAQGFVRVNSTLGADVKGTGLRRSSFRNTRPSPIKPDPRSASRPDSESVPRKAKTRCMPYGMAVEVPKGGLAKSFRINEKNMEFRWTGRFVEKEWKSGAAFFRQAAFTKAASSCNLRAEAGRGSESCETVSPRELPFPGQARRTELLEEVDDAFRVVAPSELTVVDRLTSAFADAHA